MNKLVVQLNNSIVMLENDRHCKPPLEAILRNKAGAALLRPSQSQRKRSLQWQSLQHYLLITINKLIKSYENRLYYILKSRQFLRTFFLTAFFFYVTFATL